MSKKRKSKNGNKSNRNKKPNAAQKAAIGAQLVNTTPYTPDNPGGFYEHPVESEAQTNKVSETAPIKPARQPPARASKSQSAGQSALMSFRVDAQLRDEFNACCREQDVTGSQMLRRYMKSFIERHRNPA